MSCRAASSVREQVCMRRTRERLASRYTSPRQIRTELLADAINKEDGIYALGKRRQVRRCIDDNLRAGDRGGSVRSGGGGHAAEKRRQQTSL